ncbi:hypothetical protein L284_20600 [Novosphingobium lindaniclasticum LE124]|uniref:Uncharacterized protein n=1 Tax=Novosphingobium lindaniclasticum LE124 TaxID=1096930 RepID=T0H7F7_9SPHN|nr:hypothetical protein L284_20600 [Novosphingobium lindaniclasticum LE124]
MMAPQIVPLRAQSQDVAFLSGKHPLFSLVVAT